VIHLIVNADDFGWSPGINAGVIEAHTRGIVTSTTLMVLQPAAVAAAEAAATCPELSVGLHVDLAHWTYRDGAWEPDYERVDVEDATAVAKEVDHQLDEFRRLVGRDPTHLDGHQHVQRSGAARSVLRSVADELGIPLRLHSPIVYCGAFFGQDGHGRPYPEALSVEALLDLVTGLGPGWHELGCHPGLHDDAPDGYRAERSAETAVLCDPAVRTGMTTRGVELRSFADWIGEATGGQR
jgi:predicted glycoside hydrolase/deacetylase ChbG (UPF0249 family)